MRRRVDSETVSGPRHRRAGSLLQGNGLAPITRHFLVEATAASVASTSPGFSGAR
jgi:hypothetical protein